MANVQAENGYTRIANEVLEALVKVRLPPSEKDILFFIIRKTYGYGKKQDRVSLTQFEKGTKLSRPTIVKALKNLISRKMVVRAGLLLGFNKDYENWVVRAGLLVKAPNIFGKGGFTKIGKGGFTHKRKKKLTKENTAKADIKMDIDYNTGQEIPERPKAHKREDIIKLAQLFDKTASEYSKKRIITPNSYFIVSNAINKHGLKPKGIEKLYDDWFNSEKVKDENKVKLDFALSAGNINSFKVLN